MKCVNSTDILTKDDQETFEVPELVGQDAPFCYHINSGNYGYAKFIFDKKSVAALSQKLTQIESNISRKQIYNILFDMVKSDDISGAQLLDIIYSQMKTESAVDVITEVFKKIIPLTIKKYMPPENYLEC
jgi:hypothetical protein